MMLARPPISGSPAGGSSWDDRWTIVDEQRCSSPSSTALGMNHPTTHNLSTGSKRRFTWDDVSSSPMSTAPMKTMNLSLLTTFFIKGVDQREECHLEVAS